MVNQEKKGIKIILSYENKSCAIRVENPQESIKHTLNKVMEKARNHPNIDWDLSQVTPDGRRSIYYLGIKRENGKLEILKEKKNIDEMSLFDYEVKDGG